MSASPAESPTPPSDTMLSVATPLPHFEPDPFAHLHHQHHHHQQQQQQHHHHAQSLFHPAVAAACPPFTHGQFPQQHHHPLTPASSTTGSPAPSQPLYMVHPSPPASVYTSSPLPSQPPRSLPLTPMASSNGTRTATSTPSIQPQHPPLQDAAAVAQALEIARDSPDGAQNPTVSKILDGALTEIWTRVQAAPESYVMTRDEFAVFNYFQHRFVGDKVAVGVRKRFWDNLRV